MSARPDPHVIEQIRSRLAARRAELGVRARRVADDLMRRHAPLVADGPDRAIQLQNDEALQAIETTALSDLEAVDEALERLQLGLYGVCKLCGSRIAPDRLEAVPHAVTCAQCVTAD